MLRLPLSPESDIATETSVQVFLQQASMTTYQVLDLYQKVPKFAMYGHISQTREHPTTTASDTHFNPVLDLGQHEIACPESRVSMVTTAQPSQLRSWIQEKFVIADPPFASHDMAELTYFWCLRKRLPLVLSVEPHHHQLKVMPDSSGQHRLRCDLP